MCVIFLIASVSISSPIIDCEPINLSTNPKMLCKEEEALCFEIMAPFESKAMWDLHMSPYAGGEDLLFATRILEKFETYAMGKTNIAYARNTYARFWRLTEELAIWLPLNYFAMVVQHEVFGHGYRVRDLQTHSLAVVNGYEFNWPPPYGPGGAATGYSVSEKFTTTEDTAVSSAGVEATAILALITKLKWISSGTIDPRELFLYFFSEQDLTLYVSSLKLKDVRGQSGHDMNSYIQSLNYTYTDHFLSRGRLRTLSLINFADPFTFFTVYSLFYYFSTGKEAPLPMIASCYLPGLRLGLTPFGPEVFLENFFSLNQIPLYVYLKGGNHSDNTYLGAGFYAPRIYAVNNFFFGLRCDLWRQPKLLLQPGNIPFFDIDFSLKPNPNNPLYPYSEQHAMRFGAAGSLITSYLWDQKYGYEAELGYKAQGFLPGYSLFAYPTVRLSFCMVF